MVPLSKRRYLGGNLVGGQTSTRANVVENTQQAFRDSEMLAGSVVTHRSLGVVRSLVAALGPVYGYGSSISLHLPRSAYSKLLANELQRAGYRIHLAINGSAPNLITSSIEKLSPVHTRRRYRFSLSINGISITRSFELQGDTLVPVSALQYVNSPLAGSLSSDPDAAGDESAVISK